MAKTNSPDSEFVDLGSTLGREVRVSPIATFSPEIEEAVLEEEELVPPVIETEEPLEIPSDERPKAMPYSHLAANVVNAIDGIQATLIPMWRKTTLFTSKDLEILDGLDTSGGTVYPANSPENRILLRYRKFLQYTEKMPFTEAEKERLIQAGERYCATVKIQVSPLTGLIFSVGEVLITRATYTFSDI